MNTCKDCKWFRMTDSEHNVGECHHSPPRAFITPAQNALGQTGIQSHGVYPPVKTGSYCSKYTPKILT